MMSADSWSQIGALQWPLVSVIITVSAGSNACAYITRTLCACATVRNYNSATREEPSFPTLLRTCPIAEIALLTYSLLGIYTDGEQKKKIQDDKQLRLIERREAIWEQRELYAK
ncbi:uncharacterized protein [Venturia canescens]|uniref:uncharacterized protein isoform X2 n=1 Tax=Venturia canescens TaxID=32260 RepID=UPI001C9D124D|nr:uncharacterized protein LOC122417993 isoform X2 [Venturia canescens]